MVVNTLNRTTPLPPARCVPASSFSSSSPSSSEINAGADVFVTTVGAAAFHAAIPPTVRIAAEGYNPTNEVMRVLYRGAVAVASAFYVCSGEVP